MFKALAITLIAVSTTVLLSGCGGTLSPLYADFRIEEPAVSVPGDSVQTTVVDSVLALSIKERIASALIEAGWELDDAPSENSVSTKEIEIAEWGLYDVRVSLDVVPINDKFVRVYVHPYRQYFYGSRSKMSYMNRRVRTYVFPDLADAFQARGIISIGAIPERNPLDAEEEEDSVETLSASKKEGR